MSLAPDAATAVAARGRLHWAEALPWLAAVAAFFLFPGHLAFGTQMLIAILFALSLDLILGYAGIVSLGHAAYFGAGAYAAGMLSAHLGWNEPLTGLLAAGIVAGLLGFVTGLVLMRYHGLALIMLTLALAIMLQEFANVAERWTGGFDGLLGISIDPIFGVFENDLWGRHYYVYALSVLFLCFAAVRLLIQSPLGASLVGIRENTRRMHAVGTPVYGRLVAVYTVAAALAGIAGGLFAQSNAFVTLEVLSFARSGTVLIMVVLGGAGHLYGAFIGATVYMIIEDGLAKADPVFWEFGVGLVLVLAVLFFRGGVMGLVARLLARGASP
jgi:branched-chain amino acid transport system permease protein